MLVVLPLQRMFFYVRIPYVLAMIESASECIISLIL